MADDITDLIPDPTPPNVLEGVVANDPADETDDVFVTVDEFDGQQRYGPCPWMPRATDLGPLFPSRGDSAVLLLTDKGTAVVVHWEPN